MNGAVITAVLSRIETMESDLGRLRVIVDAEQLSISDQQYVARCFDLLHMELEALRQYLGGLT